MRGQRGIGLTRLLSLSGMGLVVFFGVAVVLGVIVMTKKKTA